MGPRPSLTRILLCVFEIRGALCRVDPLKCKWETDCTVSLSLCQLPPGTHTAPSSGPRHGRQVGQDWASLGLL